MANNIGALLPKYFSWQWENTVTYKHTFNDKHDITLLAGMTAQEGTWDFWEQAKPIF